ncbi:MAG: phage portal protein [Rikenellaceae bacterium]
MSKTKIAIKNSRDPYETTQPRMPHNEEFWRWGDDNLFPNLLSLLSHRAVTHRRIINDKADYITGKGFVCDTQQSLLTNFVASANAHGESLRQVLSRVAFDKMLFANAFVEVVRNAAQSSLAIYHIDATKCRVAKDSRHIIIHSNWAEYRPSEATHLPLYPYFEEQADGSQRCVIHYKDYEPMFQHYGIPQYIAGLNVSAIAYKTDKWNISRLDNSFQMSGVMLLDNTADNDLDAERIVRTAEEKFGGKPGQVLFVLKDGSEYDNSRFISLNETSEGDWTALHEQANNDIVVAHSWFRSLSGLDYTTSFSTDRILHEYEIALNTIILAEQEELMEPIVEVLQRELGIDTSSLSIINRPPTTSKPIYMKVWEARKADGLDYDETDEKQQLFLSQITSYSITEI